MDALRGATGSFPDIEVSRSLKISVPGALSFASKFTSRITLTATLTVAAMTTSCAAPKQADRQATGQVDVVALIGDADCRTDAQCSTVGVGSKPCGGPQAYLAYSTAVTDTAVLRQAVTRQADVDRAAHRRLGIASTCSVVPDPGAVCQLPPLPSDRLGACRLGPVGHGAGSSIR